MNPSDEGKRQQIEALYTRSKSHFPEVASVTADEAREFAERDPDRTLFVDVRNPEERAVSMVPGAVSADSFLENQADHRGKTVLTYCTIGHRSGLFAKRLQADGWQVFNIEGAILSWTHAGGDLIDGEGPTRRVHVLGPTWNLTADGYEPIW